MAVKDVINRGVGTSSGLLYFITGGFDIGSAPIAQLPKARTKIVARSRRVKVVTR